MLDLFIIRHGQTDYNLKGIIQGKGINSSLNERGEKQARAFFEAYRNEDFDRIFCSTLRRTKQSLAPFEKAGYELYATPALDEIDWGIMEGEVSTPELRKEYAKLTNAWKQGDLNKKVEKGESPIDVETRLAPFLKELRTSKFKRVLLCSHGRTIRVLMCLLMDLPLSEMYQFNHHNLNLYRLEIERDKARIIVANNVEHLSSLKH